MPDSPTLQKLISRLEAEEPSRELADEVLLACGWKTDLLTRHPTIWENPNGLQTGGRPNPLESLAPAISLVPEGWQPAVLAWSGDVLEYDSPVTAMLLRAELNSDGSGVTAAGGARTAAEAMTRAALRARLADMEARSDG